MGQLTARPFWLSDKDKLCVPATGGRTIAESLPMNIAHKLHSAGAVCQVNGERLINWVDYQIEDGDHVDLMVMPMGGDGDSKSVLSAIAMIAIAVAAPQISAAYFGGTAGATAAVTIGGSLILGAINNALIKPPTQADPTTGTSDPFFTFTGTSNQITPWGVVPRTYGRMKVVPVQVVSPSLQLIADTDYMYQVFDLGHGLLAVEPDSEKLGENELIFSLDPDSDSNEFYDRHFPVAVSYDANGNATATGNAVVSPIADPVKYKQNISLRDTRVVGGRAYGGGTLLIPSQDTKTYDHYYNRDTTIFTQVFSVPTGVNRAEFRVGVPALFRQGDFGIEQMKTDLYVEYSTDGGTTWSNRLVSLYVRTSDSSIVELDKLSAWSTNYIAVPTTDKGTTRLTRPYLIGEPLLGYEIEFINLNGAGKSKIFGINGGTTGASWVDLDSVIPTWATHYRYRTINGGAGYIALSGDYLSPRAFTFTVNLSTTKNYLFRFARRTHFLYPAGDDDDKVSSKIFLESIRWWEAGTVALKPEVPHTIIEMRHRATEELSGAIQNYSCIVKAFIPLFKLAGGKWVFDKLAFSNNPADVFIAVLVDPAYRNRIKWAEIEDYVDMDQIADWRTACDGMFTCNLTVSSLTTMAETLNMIAATGRATTAFRDGRLTVIRELKDAIPVQLVTPKNSSDFSASMAYLPKPKGVRVSYIDADEDLFDRVEAVVGYNQVDSSASSSIDPTEVEDLKLPGTTNWKQAWRFARYYMAEAMLRRESISFRMDIENLVAQRGDIIRLVHDVLDVGGLPVRIESIVGTTVSVDEDMPTGSSGARIRGRETIYSITTTSGREFTAPTAMLSGAKPALVGDVIEVGVISSDKGNYIVQAITPEADMSASISAIEYRPEVIDLDDQPIPDRIPFPGSDNGVRIGPVNNLDLRMTEYVSERVRFMRKELTWTPPILGYADHYNIYAVLPNGGRRFLGRTKDTHWSLDPARISGLPADKDYTYAVTAVSHSDIASAERSVTGTIKPDTHNPSDVLGFSSNILNEQIHLFWDRPWDEDLDHYEIRYSPELRAGVTWAETSFVTSEVPYDATSVTIPARTGAYLIKAVDTAGNYSKNAAVTVTHVDQLPNIDKFHTFQFDPFTSGTHQNTEVKAGHLTLVDGVSEGWWFADEHVDLGAWPWRMRLIAQLHVFPFAPDEHLDSPWFDPLATAVPLSPASQNAENFIDAQIYYLREKDLSDEVLGSPHFDPLAKAIPLSPSLGSGHLHWQRLVSADVKASIVRFAIRLTTSKPGLHPAVDKASVLADWHERTEKGLDHRVLAGNPSTQQIKFKYPFAPITSVITKPVVTIQLQNANLGEFIVLLPYGNDSVTGLPVPENEGFSVKIFDNAGNQVDGSIDWAALGVGQGFST